ncbi:hypothetical protein IE985_11865 [Klebsiella pneumoniae]|nr:hypothetical protein [Klebsiella pneumoniae]
MNTDAAVVFDALPGQVFPAHVTSSDAGILAGQEAVNGQLSQPEQSTRCATPSGCAFTSRWISRWTNRCRPAPALRCSCTIARTFARTFAGLQIHLVSWLHYVY